MHLVTEAQESLLSLCSIKEKVDIVREDSNSMVGNKVQNNGSDGEVAFVVKVVEKLLQVQRSWISNTNHIASCQRKGIYVAWEWMVPYTSYALDFIFHTRALKHPCRVYNKNEAKQFYVPYYGGLDILRWHFKNVSNDGKENLGLELVKLLENKKSWLKHSGKDHKSMKLLIEHHLWHVNDIRIPRPTYFHPHSNNDIIERQMKIIRSNRKSLISFVGATWPGAPENIRSILINQCNSDETKYRFLNCSSGRCDKPTSVIDLFMDSEFYLRPPRDSPTRKSVFDSLVSGCIPVLFDPFTTYYQYPWHLPKDHSKYSVFIGQEEVREMKVNVVEKMMKVSVREREDMRRFIIYELLPGLVYRDSNSQLRKFQDAFSITINNVLERVSRIE
ncbi:putative copper-transporting ATPase HMA5-like [Hibiscus syriacus]|uniref:Copper-transporting ATPase HMA5-like n=1 Tax=Hibiscus syriacus TaxID=106335 RepID=A0A6A3CJX3_HIBSY|nr:putative copper-transporting ATPase HMA5-like [Hibiscus syriacus]